MKVSLVASLAFHAAILIAALVVLPAPRQEAKPVETISVDISQISDVTKKMATSKEGEEKPVKPAPKKTEKVTAKALDKAKVAEKEVKTVKEAKVEPPPPQEKPEPKKPEPPKADPPPDPSAMADLVKETIKEEPKKEEKKPEKKAEKKPEKKPEERKRKATLDTEKIMEDLNKLDEERSTLAELAQEAGSPAKGETEQKGQDNQLSATAVDALKGRIKECFVVPPGAREANVAPLVRWQLTPDGSVIGVPEVMDPSPDPLFDATARAAVAAVMNCGPYNFLPPEQYDLWKDLSLRFRPTDFDS
jgi:colicin import membrane protein